MEREQEGELQARAWAIMATQGGRTTGPSMVVANPVARACERCTKVLRDIVGCVTSTKGKVWACMPCQKA